MNFKCVINERKMIRITYNVYLIKRESIKVGQSVCNRRRNRPKLWIEEYVRRREKLQGNAGGFATPREGEREIPPFTILSFLFHLLPFFCARDVCNLPGRDRERCRNFSQRAGSENEFSNLARRERAALFFETARQKSSDKYVNTVTCYNDSYIYIHSSYYTRREKNNRKIDDRTECILSDSSRMG